MSKLVAHFAAQYYVMYIQQTPHTLYFYLYYFRKYHKILCVLILFYWSLYWYNINTNYLWVHNKYNVLFHTLMSDDWNKGCYTYATKIFLGK